LGDKNPGRSVSNAVERVRDTLLTRGFIDENAIIMVHYENSSFDHPFALVAFDADGRPEWDQMSLDEAVTFIGCSSGELLKNTLDDPRLVGEVEQIQNAINPFAESPEVEPSYVYNRRDEIRRNMISKGELLALVTTGTSERQLQQLLRRDLSIVAEIYANPKEEYIVFSEFPVGDGWVDFALFSGRSRMDVVLIEVKGAEFGFRTRGAYRNLAAKINEAAQQIRDRLRQINQNQAMFRDHVHQIRQRVESGESLYHSFVGPQGPLEVDPQKDVCVHCVVVGGTARDDREESKLRHDFEFNTSPPVRLESWDSWIRKLVRN
jgi:hypothetical protein